MSCCHCGIGNAYNGSSRGGTGEAMSFGEKMSALMAERGLSLRALARMIPADPGHLSRIRRDLTPPAQEMAERIDRALGADGALVALRRPRRAAWTEAAAAPFVGDDPVSTVEMARRLRLSGVDRPTLETLAAVTESLCTQYAYRTPRELRAEARRWFSYVGQLLEKRVGLYEHRELLVTAGWLALLIGCLEYDSGLTVAAEGTRRSALQLGAEAGHSEITAWGLEMASWFAHTRRDPERTVTFARAGQGAARSTSVSVQLVAHEARALARMGDVDGVHEALDRGHALLSQMSRPSNPRNHFVVDPGKFDFYAMDAYRVVGANDPAAAHAAEVLRTGRGPDGEDLAPMRMAEARITLATVAARTGDLEEAVQRGRDALSADRKCLPSLLLVAGELHAEIDERYPADQTVREFSEQMRELRHPPSP